MKRLKRYYAEENGVKITVKATDQAGALNNLKRHFPKLQKSQVKKVGKGRVESVNFDRVKMKNQAIKARAEAIQEQKEKKALNGYPVKTSSNGSWYELSNGEKVQGKDQAFKAEKELQK